MIVLQTDRTSSWLAGYILYTGRSICRSLPVFLRYRPGPRAETWPLLPLTPGFKSSGRAWHSVRDSYVYSIQVITSSTATTSNGDRSAPAAAVDAGVAGAAVADRTRIQVGFRRSNHFHLRSHRLANHRHLCRRMSCRLLGIRCWPAGQLKHH